MPIVSAQWDIFSLIQHFASIDVAYKSTVHGVLEIHSNCPFCPGSHDSFIMRPEIGEWNHCTRSGGCNKHGDCIDFLMLYKDMSRCEAMDFLGLEQNADYVPSERSKNVSSGPEHPPLARWQEQGKQLVERAVHALWNTSEGRIMLDYLHGRGLGDEIIKKKKLGYVPLQKNGRFYEAELEDWGLDPATCKKDKVRVANGILIPWFEGSTLWRLALKRPGEERGYGQVLGSGEGLYNVSTIQYDFPAMMVEGEICCLSVEQEAGDLISCVATGSTTRGRLARWIAELHLASYVLQSFDEDTSGDEGFKYWGGYVDQNLNEIKGALNECYRWSPYIAKDPNDIHLKKFFDWTKKEGGFSIREWVEAGLMSVKKIDKPAPLPPIPLARGKTLNELVQERRKEKGLPPMTVHPWSQKDLEDLEYSLKNMKVYGPEVDLNALTIREWKRGNLAPGICLDKNCPCGMR